ncbi:MAG: GNAT family N-acetyltransferase [Endomicrobium sp.]|jgi:ribosomal protein S18 acetylase RimI-like enzyme|nr:GNAT family N-acetyltransferase [Endomicrobium sp.]
MKIEINENEEELKKALNKIFIEDDRKNKIDPKFLAFAFSIKDDKNNILGGVRGWRIFNDIYVDELAVDKNIRRQGYGKKLLEMVEQKINDGFCDNINLVTNEFQEAIDFYKKCGFKIDFVRYNSKNEKSNKYYMVKKL